MSPGGSRWRLWRVGGLLALLAWSLSAVPDRVQAQRQAVVELASERGAASAGGAVLGAIEDLRRPDAYGTPNVWRVPAGVNTAAAPITPLPDSATPYERALAAVRARRALEAAIGAGNLPVSDAALVEVERDLYLVVTPWSEVGDPAVTADAGVTIPPMTVTGDQTVTIPAFGIPGLHIASMNVTVQLPAGAVAGTMIEATDRGGIVAWWPPIQERVLARTGIPLQVGDTPPHGRLILPGRRLAGLPVWSLPTPEAEAAITLFDGGSLLWITLLGVLLAREYRGARREAQAERDRQGTRDAILQRLSHELRTPAASVRSLVDALDHPATTDAERSQFLDLVRSEAERLATGIDRLLQAARGETILGVDPVPMDLAEWAEGVRMRWVALLPGLTLQAPPGACPAFADPERLDEAVDALLDNARKYGGMNVVLSVAPHRFAVEDDGEGIAAKDRQRVLQKFERVEGRVNDPGGHGLGLWAVGEVARAHGGRLTIEGRSRFVVTLGQR